MPLKCKHNNYPCDLFLVLHDLYGVRISAAQKNKLHLTSAASPKGSRTLVEGLAFRTGQKNEKKKHDKTGTYGFGLKKNGYNKKTIGGLWSLRLFCLTRSHMAYNAIQYLKVTSTLQYISVCLNKATERDDSRIISDYVTSNQIISG